MPPSANSKRPSRRCCAPVKAPFSCPKSSEAIKARGIAAQLTAMNARAERLERRWMARAMSSLPVPVSPVMSTVESLLATLDTRANTAVSAGDPPTISSNIEALSTSSRSATFSCRSLSSAVFRSSMSVAVPVPSRDLSAVVFERIEPEQEPTERSVVSSHPGFELVGCAFQKPLPPLIEKVLAIIWMHEVQSRRSLRIVCVGESPPFVNGDTEIFESYPIGVKRPSIGFEHTDVLRREVENLPELHFRDLTVRDVHDHADNFFVACLVPHAMCKVMKMLD